MRKHIRRRTEPGAPPGSLPRALPPERAARVEVIDYSPAGLTRTDGVSITPDLANPPEKTVRWIRVTGVPDGTILASLGSVFDIHPLVLEDVASTEQRIKTEDYDRYTYTVLRTLHYVEGQEAMDVELDLVLTERVLITTDEGSSEAFFDPIFARLKNPASLLRRGGVDMLYYAIFDLAVDCFFPLVEKYEEVSERLEASIAAGPEDYHVTAIHELRSQIQHMRSTLWATRDVASEIERNAFSGLAEQTLFYFRDAHDHVIRLLDSVTNLREVATGLMELHMSGMSNRMNEIMKVLTIIATIFIPLTFVAGIYGMNFEYMPELKWPWAYPAVLGLMLVIGVLMLLFFRDKGWLSSKSEIGGESAEESD